MTSHDTTPSGQVGARLRRIAAVPAGAALILGGFLAAPSAHAEVEDLGVEAVDNGNGTVDVTVDRCNMNSSGATYSVSDAAGTVVEPEKPIVTWNQDWKFTFLWGAIPKSGTYTITVKCLRYADRVDQVGSTAVSVTLPPPIVDYDDNSNGGGSGGANKLPGTGD